MPSPDRLLLGYCTVFGEPSLDDGAEFRAEQFTRFLVDPVLMGYPQLFAGHDAPFDPRSRLGWWFEFRSVRGSGQMPDGLLGLGVFGEGPVALSLADHVGSDPSAWSLSIAAKDISHAEDLSDLFVSEVSLTKRPGIPSSRVLAVGSGCEPLWETMTGSRMPTIPTRKARKTAGVWVPCTDGKMRQETWLEPVDQGVNP